MAYQRRLPALHGAWALATVMVVAVGAVAAPAHAQSCRFAPDRPGATTGPAVVGGGCVLVESAVQVERVVDGTTLSLPTLFRVGVGDQLELRLANALVAVALPDEGSAAASSTPLALEAKVTSFVADGRRPGWGTLVGLTAPLDKTFESNLAPYVAGLFDWSFTDDWVWSTNLGLAAAPAEDGGRYATLSLAGVLWFDVPVAGRWLGLYADGVGGMACRSDEDWQQAVGGGVAVKPTSQVQLDAGVQVVATGSEHPVIIQIGVAWLL